MQVEMDNSDEHDGQHEGQSEFVKPGGREQN